MRSFTAADLALIVAFAAVIVVLGVVAIPVGPLGIPIVLQNMGIILVALLLGSLRGGLTTLAFLAVGLVGIPNLAGGRNTLAALSGPTVGYLAGYVISAFVIGAIAQRVFARTTRQQLIVFSIAGLIGVIIQHVSGIAGLMLRTGQSLSAAAATDMVYIPGDLIKLVVAVAIAAIVHRAVPHLLPYRL